MPRNGSGTMALATTFTPNTDADAEDVNTQFEDIRDEITNSVAKDGQTSMTGPLKAASGSVSAPSVAFASDTDTGAYRSSANEYSVAAGGTQIHKTNSSGLDVVTGRVLQGGVALLPPGMIIPYAGSSAPTGWLLCDGSAVSRTTYADLFAIISTTYGSGDSSTTFNLPDLTGRVIAGKESSATRLTSAGSGVDGATLGATGGEETHTLTADESATLTYSSQVTDLGHAHNMSDTLVHANGSLNIGGWTGGSNARSDAGLDTDSATTGITVATTSTDAGDAAHNNVQPTIVLNYLIKT